MADAESPGPSLHIMTYKGSEEEEKRRFFSISYLKAVGVERVTCSAECKQKNAVSSFV
jgi:hypothetical protein